MIISHAMKRDLLILVALALALALVPLVVGERYLLGEVVIFFFWAIVATQWNLLTGHAGILSFGQMLLFACGAYTVGVLTGHADWSLWPAVAMAPLVALLVGLACLRLTGAYVALLTLAVAEMVRVLIVTDTNCLGDDPQRCELLFGGTVGFSSIPDMGFRPWLRGDWILGNYYVVLALFVVTLALTLCIVHGRYGLTFRAMRDNMGVAVARGVNRFAMQLTVFVVSAMLTGLAGAFYAAHFRFAGPSLLDFQTLILILAMVVIGGLGSVWGPVIGAGVIMVVIELAKSIGDARNLILGLLLLGALLVLPRGIASLRGMFLRS